MQALCNKQIGMTDISTLGALRILQSADSFRARLAGDFSSVHGISVNEFFLLMHLDKAEMQRLPRVELAKRTYVSASTITRTVAPMEKIGLLARQSDARDARLAFVVLTDAGASKLAEAKATFAKHAQAVFQDRWTEEEQDQLASLLHRLVMTSPANLT